MNRVTIFILLTIFQVSFAQDEQFFKRLMALDQEGVVFYNVDGRGFVSYKTLLKFNDKNLKEEYEKSKIKKTDVKQVDKKLGFKNYKFTIVRKNEGLTETFVHYFVEDKDKNISVFAFTYDDKVKAQFERKIIELILNDKIPKTCFSSLKTDKFNFVGRTIEIDGFLDLVGKCHWKGVNNLQCPNYGQIDWSIHQTKESSDLEIKKRFKRLNRIGKLISEKKVEVIFEGVKTNARKVSFEFTGFANHMVSSRLNIYLISEKLRGNYVSCILSYYDTDASSDELPKLLEKVMRIEYPLRGRSLIINVGN